MPQNLNVKPCTRRLLGTCQPHTLTCHDGPISCSITNRTSCEPQYHHRSTRNNSCPMSTMTTTAVKSSNSAMCPTKEKPNTKLSDVYFEIYDLACDKLVDRVFRGLYMGQRRLPGKPELRHVVEVAHDDPMCDKFNAFIKGLNKIEGMFNINILLFFYKHVPSLFSCSCCQIMVTYSSIVLLYGSSIEKKSLSFSFLYGSRCDNPKTETSSLPWSPPARY